MTKTLKLTAAQKYSVTCPTCGSAVNKSCKKMTGRVGSAYRMHPARVQAATAKLVAEAPGTEVIWMWNWVSGGYNTCRAPSRWVALEKAKALGQGWKSGGVNEASLRIVSQDEVNKTDASWAPFFD